MGDTQSERAAMVLPVSFFHQSADIVARALLGCVITSSIGGVVVSARIVETEAYLGIDDPASHAYQGRRHANNAGVYAEPASWYVYRSYGIHWCMNLCTHGPAEGSAVLLRALEPMAGIDIMRARRKRERVGELCSGPGRLTQALGVTRALDGMMMQGSDVLVFEGTNTRPEAVAVGPRIGITRAADWPQRYGLVGATMSRPFSASSVAAAGQ